MRVLECSVSELESPIFENENISRYLQTKRLLDIAFAILMIVGLSPVFIVTAIAVRLSSRGPIFYSQKRLTKDGRVFRMYKFRSMTVDAEQHSGPQWASANDPRITAIGRWLRKLRIDELPQLFNVLRGEMSLIGPRPERPELAAKIKAEVPGFGLRLQVPAGITGLAQVSAGYAEDTMDHATKLALDLAYIKACSLKLDLRIALATIRVMLSGFGAR
jgi:exopolysaccharide biosynthesis polyprenyl glycosylphosphotransferase